jgi:acetyltransferase-like isoleucine patch superfamily enzyme
VINSGATVEDGAFIGSGVTVVSGVTIGRNARVGAGSVVIESVKNNATVFGNPAVPLGPK